MNFIQGFILGFLSSLAAGYFFYYISVEIPRKRDREKIYEYTSTLIQAILAECRFVVFNAIFRETGITKEYENLTIEDVKLLCFKFSLKKAAPARFGLVLITGYSFAQYLVLSKEETIANIQKLFTYLPFLDSELIRKVNRLLNCGYFYLCDQWLKNINLFSEPTLDAFADALFEYYKLIRDLETYAISNNIIKKLGT